MKATTQIFLSYAREDEEKVGKLYQSLSDAGFKPWMDTKDILPGEKWPSSIRRAIRDSDFLLLCLSKNSVDKRGWIQREIREALDVLQGMLDSDIYLIPVRLEDCRAPESLREFQWVNLFEGGGWARLAKAIQVGMERRGKDIGPIVEKLMDLAPEPREEQPPSEQIPDLRGDGLRELDEWNKLLQRLDSSFSPVYEEVKRLQVEGRAAWTIDKDRVVSSWELCKSSALSELRAFTQMAKFISSETREAVDSLTSVQRRIDRDIKASNYGKLTDSIRQFHDLVSRYRTEGTQWLSERLRA